MGICINCRHKFKDTPKDLAPFYWCSIECKRKFHRENWNCPVLEGEEAKKFLKDTGLQDTNI